MEIAAKNDAKIIVLPEACITGYASQDFHVSWCIPNRYSSHLNKSRFKPLDPEKYAQFNDIKTNKILQHFIKLCKTYQIYLTIPYIEKVKNPQPQPKDVHDDIAYNPNYNDNNDYKNHISIDNCNSDKTSCNHNYNKCNCNCNAANISLNVNVTLNQKNSQGDERKSGVDHNGLNDEINMYSSLKAKHDEFPWNNYLYYNSVSLINPKGEIAGHYRKTNLWPTYDNCWATAGDNITVIDTEYGKVGLGICFDIHKILSEYCEKNIWCLLYSIAWVSGYNIFEEEIMFRWFNMILPEKLRKMKINYYIIGANWSVKDPIPIDDGFDHYVRGSKFNKQNSKNTDENKNGIDEYDDDDDESLNNWNYANSNEKLQNLNVNVNIINDETEINSDKKYMHMKNKHQQLESKNKTNVNNLGFENNDGSHHNKDNQDKIIGLEKKDIKQKNIEDDINVDVSIGPTEKDIQNYVKKMMQVNEREMDRKMGYDWLGYGWSTIYGPFGTILNQSKKLYDNDILYCNLPFQPSTVHSSYT